MMAWHFVGETLRDGRPVPADGQVLRHDGRVVMCRSGLHASRRIIDALEYAPGSIICRVECGGEVIEDDDKLVCSERTILWRIDGEQVLREFARQCALDVAHLWDMPDEVRRYLETGAEELRSAARNAAGAAAWYAARDAAWDKARAAAWYAARDAARAAAGAAARDAAWDAARDAAWDTARDAAWDTARAAAWYAARDAAWYAARDAAWDTARDAQNDRLEAMVRAIREGS